MTDPARCEVLDLAGRVIAAAHVYTQNGIRHVSLPQAAIEKMAAIRSLDADGNLLELIDLSNRREVAEGVMQEFIARMRAAPPIDL